MTQKEKQFNKWFSSTLMGLMALVIAVTTAIKLRSPDARGGMLLVAAFGSVMGVACTVLSANGKIFTFLFGLLDVVLCSIVAADNGVWGNFALHVFYFLPMQLVGIAQWRRRGADTTGKAVRARRLTWRQRGLVATLIPLCTAMAYFALLQVKSWTGEANPDRMRVFFDAAVLVCNIAGQTLLSLAFYEQWYVWILVNIFSLLLWGNTMRSSPGSSYTVVMFIKYAFYLVNALNGLRIWHALSRPAEQGEKPGEAGCGERRE